MVGDPFGANWPAAVALAKVEPFQVPNRTQI